MTRKSTLLTFVLATLVATPAWAAPAASDGRGNCSDVEPRTDIAGQRS